MFRTKLVGMFVAVAVAIGFNAGSADAAFIAHHGGAAFRANPAMGRGGAIRHSGTTVVRPTPVLPGGPMVFHGSRTTGFRR